MGDPYTYIRDGEILTGEDGILAKVKSKASEVVNKLKRSLNIDKAKTVEEVPDELINNLVSAFKDGALKFKPGLETKRDNSSFKTTSNQSTEVNHTLEGNKNVTIENSTKEGSATWKDGGHATFTLGGDPIVDGGAGAYLDANYNISSRRIEKDSDPNSDGFNYRGVDVNKSATGHVKTGGHVEVCGRRLDVPIDVHGEANCGYSHSKEDGTIHNQSTDGNKLMNTTESKHVRSVGGRVGTSGGLSVMGHSINADAGAHFDAGCSVSSKHIDGESLPNIDGYEYEGTETEYAAAAHVNSEAHLNASANVLGKTAGVNTTGKLKADGKVRCSHLNFKEKSSTPNETRERRVFNKVTAEGSGEFEASVNGNAFLGDKSKDFGASVKGKARGRTEATAAEWDYTKTKEGFTGHFEALSAEAEGEAELEASIGSKSVKMMADGRVAAKAVEATADLTVQKDEHKTSIGGIHANIGNLSARGRAGIKLPGKDEKSVEAEAEFKLASVNALQAEVREKEHCDEADIHVKTGFVNANTGNAKVVGEKTGKKATMSMDNTFAELNAGNVSITGIDNRESNRTGVNARVRTTHTANIGNVDITGLGSRETRFEVNTAPGVDAFNFRCGIHRNTGGSVSTNRASFCNVDLTIGPPNWNISFGNSVGNIAIPFFGGGGSGGGGGSSHGGNPNQSGGDDDEDDTSENQQNGGDSRNRNATGNGGNSTGNDGNGTGNGGNSTGTGSDGTGTSGNGTGMGGDGTGTGRNGAGGNSSGHGGNGTGRNGNGTDRNGNGTSTGGNGTGRNGNGTSTGGNGTGRNGNGTGRNGNGTSTGGNGTGRNGNGTSTGGNGTGRNGNGTGRNGNGTSTGGNGTGRNGNGIGRNGNGTSTGGNGTGTNGNGTGTNENGIGRGGNGTDRNGNGNGIHGNGTVRNGNGTGRNGTGTVRIENCTGTCRNGLIGQSGVGRNGNGTSGNGNDTGRNDTGSHDTGRNGTVRKGTGTVRKGNGTGTCRNGLDGQPGVGDVGLKKPKLNLRDTADQNRMLAELVGNNFTKPSGNPRRSMRNHSSGVTPMDWSNAEKIEEHLYKTYNPNYTSDDKQYGSSQSGSRDSKKSKPQQKQPPQKPSGSNKNIHTIFTIGAGDSKPIQKLSNNVYGFGNDE